MDRRNHYLENKSNKRSGADVITEESFVVFWEIEMPIAVSWSILRWGRYILVDK